MERRSSRWFRASRRLPSSSSLLAVAEPIPLSTCAAARTLWPLLTGLALTVGVTGALYMAALRETTVATAVLLNNTSALTWHSSPRRC